MTDQDSDTLRKLSDAAHVFGVVVRVLADRSIVACSDGKIVETHTQEGALSGATVLMVEETRQILKTAMALGIGPTVPVITVDKPFCEVQVGGEVRRILNPLDDLEPGCKVLLDATGTVVMKNLGDELGNAFQGETNVSWDDIGGLEEVKVLMRLAIEAPVQHAALYKKYKQRRVKGVLLYGPTGVGKTMLGKAAATSIRKIHGGKGAATSFIYVKGPEILNMYVGNSERSVRALFAAARKHSTKYGYPAIIYIDEADALLRTRTGKQATSGVENTVVPQFLAEMDGLEDTGALVILATNLPQELDSAVVREGRIDRKIYVGRPSVEDAKDIFRKNLKGRPLKGVLSNDLADQAAKELYHSKRSFYEVILKNAKSVRVALGDLTNGAMIAAIVDRAVDYAIERDIKDKKPEGTGISVEDVMHAIDFMDAQNRHVDHERDLQDILAKIAPHIESTQRVKGETYVSSVTAPSSEEEGGASNQAHQGAQAGRAVDGTQVN